MNKQWNKDNIIKHINKKPYDKTVFKSIRIIINANEVIKEKKKLIPISSTLMKFTGQRPKLIKAKDSIAAFKIRKDMEIGAITTLRNQKIEEIYTKLIINLPKLNANYFSKYTKKGNYSIGIPNFNIFNITKTNMDFGGLISFEMSQDLYSNLFYLRYKLLPLYLPSSS